MGAGLLCSGAAVVRPMIEQQSALPVTGRGSHCWGPLQSSAAEATLGNTNGEKFNTGKFI